MDYTDYDTRLAAYAVIVDDRDRILLSSWNEPAEPVWTMPGGGIELHESLEEGLVRELREETGYAVTPGRLLGLHTNVVPAERRFVETERVLRNVGAVFEAEVVGGDLTFEVDGTTDEARWIPLSEVPGLPRTPAVDVAIELWRARPGTP